MKKGPNIDDLEDADTTGLHDTVLRADKFTTVPLTHFQQALVPDLARPDCAPNLKHSWIIAEALHIRPSFSPRRLDRAVRRLIMRHDSLRLSFHACNGSWQGRISGAPNTTLDIIDIGDTPQARINEIVSEYASRPLEVDGATLCDFSIFRFGAQGDVNLMRVHHTIIDGYGMLVLVEDLMRLILNLPFEGKCLSHIEYVTKIEPKLARYGGDIAKYWDDLLLPPPAPLPTKAAMDPNYNVMQSTENSVKNYHMVRLKSATDKGIESLAKKENISLYALISCATAQALFERTGCDDLLMLNVVGRSHQALQNYAGAHIYFGCMRTRISDGETLVARAKALQKQLQTSHTNLSVEMLTPYGKLDYDLGQAGGSRRQVLMLLPAADGRARSSTFNKVFRSKAGSEIVIGPIKISRPEITRKMMVLAQFAVHLVPDEKGNSIRFLSDQRAYDQAELEELAGRIMQIVEAL